MSLEGEACFLALPSIFVQYSGDMLTAITRKPARSLSECELTFVERTPIDYEKAVSQHDDYERILREYGCSIVSLPAEEEHPDSVFVEDTAVIFDEIAVLMSPGVRSRVAEIGLMAPVLSKYRAQFIGIRPPALIEGGDVLTVDKTVFVGHSTRTNTLGIETLASILKPFGYTIIPVPVDGCLHLKSACTALDENTLLINPERVDPDKFKGFRTVEVGEREPFAANSVRLGDKILMQFEPEMVTAALVRRAGFIIRGIDLSEFRKAEAGPSCLSLIFEDKTGGLSSEESAVNSEQ